MLDNIIIDNLKRVDPDRYRAAMFAPSAQRQALLTLYAFHAELAKIPELVSEAMIGDIRYQWWRDAVEEIYGKGTVRKHEVTLPLAEIVKTYDIPRYWLDRLINGRNRDLDPTPFASLERASEYCRETSGVLMQIAAHIVEPKADLDAICDLGEAWGLTGLSRSWKFYTGGMLLNLNFEDVLDAALNRYDKSAQLLAGAKAELMPAIAYGALIPKFHKIMTKNTYDPHKQSPNYGVLSKQIRLMGAIIRGKI